MSDFNQPDPPDHAAAHPFQCQGYRDEGGKVCYQRFKTAKELRRHKKHRDDHDFCAKCNKDFKSWADFVKHKSEEPIQHPAACRVCGEEFGSISGMKRHLAMSHPIDQEIPCKGCGEVFSRASQLIHHLESGMCKVISGSQFAGHLAHKTIVTKLLKSPDQLDKMNAIASYEDANEDDEEGGGVAIAPMDSSDGQLLTYETLKPERAPESLNPPRLGEAFPALGSSNIKNSNSINSLSNRLETVVLSQNSRAANGSNVTITDYKNPWNGQGISKALFPAAKETPVTDEYKYKLQTRDLVDENGGINLLKNRFWDPTSRDFDPQRFYHPILEKYQCPFPHCDAKFEEDFDLEKHIVGEHRITDLRCPTCQKIYKSSAALVAHSEAPNSRCHLSRSDKFSQALDIFSGGFLDASYVIRPDHIPHEDPEKEYVIEPDTRKVKVIKKQPLPVGYTRYESTKPPDWVEPGTELDYKKWTV